MQIRFGRRDLFGLAAALPLRAQRAPVILLRSGWQTVNIGDIAHTPGVLRLLSLHYPAARVIVWSHALDRGVDAMLLRGWPSIGFVRSESEAKDAFRTADFFLHGSGPGVVARNHLEMWRAEAKKPYGIFGVTVTATSEAASSALDPGLKDLLDGARFVFTRETKSLANLQRAKVRAPDLRFVPDGAFSFHLRDDERASAFLREHSLQPGKFIAVVPRLRYTPYHRIRKVDWTPEETARRDAANERHAEPDHAKLRAAIVRWARETGGKSLLCPEMTYQSDIIVPLLYDPLPPDVKQNVVPRPSYWLPDEAASTYASAAAVVSFECHSPILAASQGTPCFYVHQPEDGIKGQMWKDANLASSYFEVEQATGEEIAAAVLHAGTRPDARRTLRAAVDRVRLIQRDGMVRVKRAAG